MLPRGLPGTPCLHPALHGAQDGDGAAQAHGGACCGMLPQPSEAGSTPCPPTRMGHHAHPWGLA